MFRGGVRRVASPGRLDRRFAGSPCAGEEEPERGWRRRTADSAILRAESGVNRLSAGGGFEVEIGLVLDRDRADHLNPHTSGTRFRHYLGIAAFGSSSISLRTLSLPDKRP